MMRTQYLENPSHQQFAMQFELLNSSLLILFDILLHLSLKVTTYSEGANVVQIQCLQLFDDYKVKRVII